jgi:hypothetical protein
MCITTTPVILNWRDRDGNVQISPGDCLEYPPSFASMVDFSTEATMSGKLPGYNETVFDMVLDAECRGRMVVAVHAARDFPQQSSSSAVQSPPQDFTCPNGTQPMLRTAGPTTPSSSSSPRDRVTTTTGRGAGVPVSSCGSDQDKDGALCYPKCRTGFYGVGPVCYASCPSGWDDQGLVCAAHTYAPGSCAIQCTTHKDWSTTCGCPTNKPHNCACKCLATSSASACLAKPTHLVVLAALT